MTLYPFKEGRCLVWDVTVVDTLATSHINETSKKDARDISSDASKESPKYASLDHLERIGTIESTQQERAYVNSNWNKF